MCKVYLHLSNIYDYDFINNPDVIKNVKLLNDVQNQTVI